MTSSPTVDPAEPDIAVDPAVPAVDAEPADPAPAEPLADAQYGGPSADVTAAAVTAPHVAVSIHAWDPYYNRPGPSETMTTAFRSHLDALANLNKSTPNTVTRVRVDMGWSASQPTSRPPDPNHYYNKRFTRLFTELANRGLKPFVVVHQSPVWARPPGTPTKHLPTDPQKIVEWAGWFARQYAPWVSEVEFWNEPNLEAFSGAGWATPARYVPVLAAFTAAAHAANPKLKVIGGNVSQCDWLWLRKAYDTGLGEHCDVLGVHPYQGNQAIHPTSINVSGIDKKQPGWEKGRISAGLPKIGTVMDSYGDSAKPIWANEVGWSASATGVTSAKVGRGQTWTTRAEKAAAFQTELLTMLATAHDDGGEEPVYRRVRCVTVYQLFDPLSKDPHQKGFEVVEPGGTFKSQAHALTNFRRAYPRLRPIT